MKLKHFQTLEFNFKDSNTFNEEWEPRISHYLDIRNVGTFFNTAIAL